MIVRAYHSIPRPSVLFEPGGLLHGFDRASITPPEMLSDRAARLRTALGLDEDAVNLLLGRLPDGRLALLRFDDLHSFAVEAHDADGLLPPEAAGWPGPAHT